NVGGAAGSVDFFTADGSAVSGTDYLGTNGTLTFQAGQTRTNFTISIIDNGAVNSNKTVLLFLTNASPSAVLGTPSSATLTILDDDASPVKAGEFNFSAFVDGSAFFLATENETFFDFNPQSCAN